MEAPTSTRHPAGSNDKAVIFLESLERLYTQEGPQKNATNARLLEKITVYPDKISFLLDDGISIALRRANEQAQHAADWVIITEKYTLVRWDVALKLFTKKLPSKQDIQKILDIIPGRNDHSQAENMQHILSLPLTGFINRDGKICGDSNKTGFWSYSKAGTGIWHMELCEVGELPTVTWHHSDFYFPIRLLA